MAVGGREVGMAGTGDGGVCVATGVLQAATARIKAMKGRKSLRVDIGILS
jgi:hypothetical protein